MLGISRTLNDLRCRHDRQRRLSGRDASEGDDDDGRSEESWCGYKRCCLSLVYGELWQVEDEQ